ncbi:MAG: hypothetical protein B7Z80_00190 [Rhodospirillales bacterium 20-64-7]|nr:MAG: hypothetical protein B7Z80_00190 [Rhodospirillales bacterium 20-64-7]HQT75441.1 hypothetical protein [Rhodopila sp.]
MTLDLADCAFSGPALPEPFLRTGLELTASAGLEATWDNLRVGLRSGGEHRVHTFITTRITTALGYARPVRQAPMMTREGAEDAGWLAQARDGGSLRVWSFGEETDLDAGARTPRTSRSSPMRVAQRVLLASGERVGLLTNGAVLRVVLCDPVRADSHVSIDIGDWRSRPLPPDSFRILMNLTGAEVLPNLPTLLDAARLHQARVTKDLRRQAKEAITGFINALPERGGLEAETLWREALVLVYRLLFILKLESPAEPGAGFSFASAALWSGALSPNRALGPLVRRHLDQGHATGRMLEGGLRLLFAIFRGGVACAELRIVPLGGALFGAASTPALDRLVWGERAVAILMDRLIWTTTPGGARARVHYGSLGVEELGGIYESLLEQEPGIADEPLRRMRRGKVEAMVPAAGAPADVPEGHFFLRAGLGRKASGSFYTPREFVRFIVRETLGPAVAAASPPDDPHPVRLLAVKVVDPGMGSGHFLVEACRFLADALLTACRIADERGLHNRIAALPDPDNSLAAYLPSRGWAEAQARAICRRLVAVHCLYGCDRNALAVELAKLSLWLESYAEGLPLTFLDHRLVQGDALTGPFFENLTTLPVTGGGLDPLLAAGVAERLQAALARAQHLVRALDASIGRDVLDLERKQGLKQRLDAALHPLRQLARAWAGGAMGGERDADDVWLALAAHVADAGGWPDRLTPRQQVLLDAGADAVAWDLVFPEARGGFAAVLGNPPWDVVLPNTLDFVSGVDPGVLDAPASERAAVQRAVLSRPAVAAAFERYRAGFDRLKRIAGQLYQHQRIGVGGDTTAGNLDLFRLFAERAVRLAGADGAIGLLVPSAFHANEGTTGIRRLYLQETRIAWCLSFENRRRIFDIDSRFKFNVLVAHRPGPTHAFRAGFYLDRIEDADRFMVYDLPFLTASGGPNLTPLELRGPDELAVARVMFQRADRLRAWCGSRRIRLGRDLHMTGDAGCFQPAGAADLVLHEGKTFHQYTDRWDVAPRYSVATAAIRPAIAEAALHYRLVFRDIARATDERTMIACIAPPGTVFGHTATVEKAPWARSIADALALCAVFNSFPFDWLVRQKAATHLSLYILDALPMPDLPEHEWRFLAQGALLLSCQHAGYDALRQALPDDPPLPAVRQDVLRARIDAVVARGYRLTREGYAQVLRGFSHRSWPEAPALCLDAFSAEPAPPR